MSISPLYGETSLPSLQLETVDRYLEEIESAYPDIVDGTARNVRWHDGRKRTDLAIVYIHGFSASAREISPVTEDLADLLGANTYYARLAGHGRSDDAMAEATIEQWQENAREAWRIGQLIGKEVIVISVSTGGTLAAWLANQTEAASMKANILISPNFGIASRSGEIVRWEIGFKLAKWLSGPYRQFEPQNELHRKYWTERYPIEAIVPMVKLVDQVVEQDYSLVSIPHLMVYSPHDKVIRVDRIKSIASKMINAKVNLMPYTNSTDPYQHVLAGDACSPSTSAEVTALLKNYIESL